MRGDGDGGVVAVAAVDGEGGLFLVAVLPAGVTYVPWYVLARSTRVLDDGVNLWFLRSWPWVCVGAVGVWAVVVMAWGSIG